MLRRQPKEKDRRKIAIPEELREALREALFLIKESERDPDVRVDYGDAIQVPPWLVGGRVGSTKRPFELTYYVNGNRKTQWHLALHPLEIEDIADGCQTDIALYCCRTPNCGHKTSDPEFLCDCEYDNDPYFGHVKLPDTAEALIRKGVLGVSESSSREDVIKVLGEPRESGGGQKHPSHGYILPWIKYYRDDCQLHFEFDRSGTLRMLTIMEADWSPGI